MSIISSHERCPNCGKREELIVRTEPTIQKKQVRLQVQLHCAHCGFLRADTVIALSEREFTWY